MKRKLQNVITYDIWSKLPRCWFFDQSGGDEGRFTQHYVWLFGRRRDIWKWRK